jgi:hypothetical protein
MDSSMTQSLQQMRRGLRVCNVYRKLNVLFYLLSSKQKSKSERRVKRAKAFIQKTEKVKNCSIFYDPILKKKNSLKSKLFRAYQNLPTFFFNMAPMCLLCHKSFLSYSKNKINCLGSSGSHCTNEIEFSMYIRHNSDFKMYLSPPSV